MSRSDLRRVLPLSLLLVFLATPAAAQPQATTSEEPLSDRRVAYRIEARLHPDERLVKGQMQLTWHNPGHMPVRELQFHFYLNAFRSARSTFMRESGGSHRGFEAEGVDAWGGLDVGRMTVAEGPGAGTALTGRLRFIHPDEPNPHDSTVAAVALPQAVPPGDSITLAIDFTARLPRVVARTGWSERHDGQLFFMVAQWFPKLGIYEVPGQRHVPEDAPRGRWSTHTFHANAEFYADFGTYDVTLTVPEDYLVGAVGVRTDEERADSLRTLTYRAEDVHDFAWTASPAFEVYHEPWAHVDVRLLMMPEHAGQVERHLEAVRAAMDRFDAWVGPYPYTTLTVVDAPGGAGGMEYPTLITVGTVYGMPSWIRAPEFTAIHEFGHQYFYGMLASNEAEEAWLDEGFTSYLGARVMDEAYGPGSVLDVPGLRVGAFEWHHVGFERGEPSRSASVETSWEYRYNDYGTASYDKPAATLRTLERYLGWPTMQRVLQAFYRRWAFRHPTTEDFVAVAEEVAGEELDWFFDPFVYGTAEVDYAVDRLANWRLPDRDGTPFFRSEVRIHRQGDGVFPVMLRLRFADGTVETKRWDGEDEWKAFVSDRPARLAEVTIDPEHVLWLETDRLDNRRVLGDDGSPTGRKVQFKVLVWLQQLFYLL